MYAAVDPYTETHAISISFAYFFSFLREKAHLYVHADALFSFFAVFLEKRQKT